MKKRTLTLIVTIALAISLVGNANALSSFSQNEKITSLAVQSVEDILIEELSNFYTINDISSVIENANITHDTFSVNIHSVIYMTLLAQSPLELPAVRGMLSAVGVDSESIATQTIGDGCNISLLQNDATLSQLIKANPQKTSKEVVTAAKIISAELTELQEYIGKKQEIHYYTKVVGSISDEGVIISDLLADDGAGGYLPISAALPESSETMYNDSKSALWAAVSTKVALENKIDTYAISSDDYDTKRIKARDYARQWVYGGGKKPDEPSGLACSVCGKSSADCRSYCVYEYYNNDVYSPYKHSDCANFASQALVAGGLNPNKTWEYGTTAWNYAWGLEDYLVDNNLVTDTGYTMAHAGGLVFCKSSPDADAYHVEVIVKNDTITREFCGHTHDRYNTGIVNDSNWKYYNVNY